MTEARIESISFDQTATMCIPERLSGSQFVVIQSCGCSTDHSSPVSGRSTKTNLEQKMFKTASFSPLGYISQTFFLEGRVDQLKISRTFILFVPLLRHESLRISHFPQRNRGNEGEVPIYNLTKIIIIPLDVIELA
jgi:hypothetical protein